MAPINLVTDYINPLQLSGESVTEASKSDAAAFDKCYNWYINNQKVTPENASLAAKVWVQKYALHDSSGICIERTPEDMWNRIANTLADVEVKTNNVNKDKDFWVKEFREVLTNWKYTPQGSGLYALGNPHVKASSSNCFVLPPPKDSLESIMSTAKDMASVYKRRGGIGFDLSELRPAGSLTSNAAKSSSGATSFMDFYSKVTATIGMEGRRGALLMSMRVDHPDIFRFISEKQDIDKQWFFDELKDAGIDINDWKYASIAERLKSTSNANVSVKLTDEFIRAVETDSDFELWYEFEDNKYPRVSTMVKAKDIWDKLMLGAWSSAEPGMFNWSLMVKESIGDCYGKVTYDNQECDLSLTSSNPCGELVMNPDSCSLGTHNLPAFVKNPFKANAEFDWDEFIRVIKLSTRMQDNVKSWDISLEDVLLPVHALAGKVGRRIGLGCHGLSDAIAMLGIRFDSDIALEIIDRIYSTLKNTAYMESVQLGKEKGIFPIFDWEKEKDNPFLNRLDSSVLSEIAKYGRRNISILTNAPTGSISILSRNCSSGIEPCFMVSYLRNVKIPGSTSVEQHTIYHQAVSDCILAKGDPSIFIESHSMVGLNRIKIQSTIQKHIDHSISVTTNLPENTSIEEVSALYLEAFKSGCKGFTIYRENSRGSVMSSIKTTASLKQKFPIERPKVTDVDIFKTKYKDRNYMILVGKVGDTPCEIFGGEETGLSLPTKYKSATLTKKSRGHYTLHVQLSEDPEDSLKVNNIGNLFPAQDVITITRMISLSLRNGISISDIMEQLSKASSAIYDAPAVFARVLKNYISDADLISKEVSKGKKCPDCGEPLEYKRESGCLVELCPSCSFSNSKCG